MSPPSLDTLLGPGAELAEFLNVLLELTPPTSERLTAELRALYANDMDGNRRQPSSHAELLRDGEQLVNRWEGPESKVGIVEGHPRIGEGDVLSELSKREQGLLDGKPPTTQATLDRLKDLNTAYERCFPQLRFVTFVNGRSRAAIVPELEHVVSSASGKVQDVGSSAWVAECERAVRDVWRIGHARLEQMLAS